MGHRESVSCSLIYFSITAKLLRVPRYSYRILANRFQFLDKFTDTFLSADRYRPQEIFTNSHRILFQIVTPTPRPESSYVILENFDDNCRITRSLLSRARVIGAKSYVSTRSRFVPGSASAVREFSLANTARSCCELTLTERKRRERNSDLSLMHQDDYKKY